VPTYSAGTATLDCIPSLRGFHQKIRAGLKGINPEIAVPVTPDLTGFRSKLRAQLGQAPTVEIKTDVDTASALAKLRAFAAVGGRAAIINGSVDLDTGAALAKLGVLSAAGAGIGVGIAGGVGVAGAALAALPAAILAVIGPVSALAIGLQGVPDAFKAFSDAENNAAQNATANAKAQTAAARQILLARQQVTQAQTQLSRAYGDASAAQVSATRRVIDAERARLRAQQDLTQAVDDARRAQQALAFQVAGGALAERQAVLDLAEAQQALQAAQTGGTSGAALERVQLAYEQQALSLEEIRARNTQLAHEKAASDAAGVKGSSQVVTAQERVADATRDVADAQADAARTQVQAQRSIADAQLQVAQAQQQLTAALVDAGTVGAAATDKINAAMAKLSPSAREFVTSIRGLKPEFDALKLSVQEALFSGLGPAFENFARTTLPAMTGNLSLVSAAINGVTKDMLGFLATQETVARFQGLFAGIAKSITASGPVAETFVGLFLNLASAAMPGITLLVQALGTVGTVLSAALQPLIDSGAIAQAMTLVAGVITALGPILATVIAFAVELMNALGPSLIAIIQALSPVISVLAGVLLQIAPVVGEIVLAVADALLPVFAALAPVVTALLPIIADLIDSALVVLVPLIQGLAEVAVALMPAIQGVAGVIAALVPVIAPLITQLAAALIPLIQALVPVITTLAGIIGAALISAIQAVIPAVIMIVEALTPLIPVIGQIVTQLLSALMPILPILGGLFTSVITALLPILPPLLDLAMLLLPALVLVINLLMPIIQLLADILVGVLAGAITAVVLPTLELIIASLKGLGGFFSWLYDKVIKPIWDGIVRVIEGAWLEHLKPIFDFLGDACRAVGDAFTRMGDTIGGIWDTIKNVVHGGIQAIVDIVYNNGIRRLANEVIRYIPNVDYLPELRIPAFAHGGVLPGYAPGRDVIPVLASPGEGWLVPEAVRGLGTGFVGWANRYFSSGRSSGGMNTGGRRFADGGIVTAGGTATTAAVAPITIDPAALAALGDIAAAVTQQVSLLVEQLTAFTGTLVTVVNPAILAVSYTITTVAVPAVLLYGQQTMLTAVLVSYQWAVMTAAVNNSVSAQGVALATLQNALAATRTAIAYTADWATAQFDRIRAAAADPIRWVLQFPVNAGIITAWNTLDGQFSLGKHVDSVPVAFAVGGPVPGRGNKDSVKAYLMPGEYVLSKPAIANLGGVASVDRLHQMARAGVIGPDAHLGRRMGDAARRQRLMRTVPLDGLGFAYGGVQPHVAVAGAEVERAVGRSPGGIGGVGARPNASDHPSGHALDFMTLTNQPLGDKIVGYLQTNAARLLVKYLIWKQQINEGSGWSKMADRGSITANHFDHVHTSFLRAGLAGRPFPGEGGFFDPAALIGPYFADTYRMIGQITTLFAGNLLAAQAAGITTTAADGARAAALSALTRLTATSAGAAGSPEVVAAVRSVAARFGWGSGPEWNALSELISHESGWNPNVANPTSSARGLFQKLTAMHGPLEPTVGGQAEWGLSYVKNRYRSPIGAWSAWQSRSPHWYDQGGMLGGLGWFYKGTHEPERVLSPAQTRAFDTLVAAVGSGRLNPLAAGVGAGSAGGEFTGQLYLDSGELLGVVRGEINRANDETGRALTRRTRI
jgi:phage-related protein